MDATFEAGTNERLLLLLLGPVHKGGQSDRLTDDSIESETITWRLETWKHRKRPTVSQHHSHHTLLKVRVQSHKK